MGSSTSTDSGRASLVEQTSANTQRKRRSPIRQLLVCNLGLIDYQEAWNLQRRLVERRRENAIPDVLLLLEHPPTYTLGRRGGRENILLSPRQLVRRKIKVLEVDRGGDVTYHGPGQLVGYPILKLPAGGLDYVGYIRAVEGALLVACRDLGVQAELVEGFSGVWVGDEKLCAIGVKIDAAGVTSHGFALNVAPDLSYFDHIIPCGLKDKGVTSLEATVQSVANVEMVEQVVVKRVAQTFHLEPEAVSAGDLEDRLVLS